MYNSQVIVQIEMCNTEVIVQIEMYDTEVIVQLHKCVRHIYVTVQFIEMYNSYVTLVNRNI